MQSVSHSDPSSQLAPLDVVERTELFSRLAPEQKRALAAIGSIVRAEAGHRFVAEGAQPETLFVVASGEVEITRRVAAGSERHAIRTMGPGQTFGELALLEELPTSASVYALAPTTVLAIPLAELQRLTGRDPRFEPLFRPLAEQLSARLRSLTDVTVGALEREAAELRARVAVGTLLMWLVAILTVFTYSLSLSRQLVKSGMYAPVTFSILLLGLVGMGVMIRSTRLPPAFWGFTTRGWRLAVRDALLYSLPVIALFLALKWAAIRWVPGWEGVPLFQLRPLLESGDAQALRTYLVLLGAYVLISAPLQEVVTRGCLQGALGEFLTGPHRAFWAIVISNLFFSVTHSFLSPQIALLTLAPGLFWGWLYHRQRTLIGPILSHLVIGVAASELGFFALFT